jgi:hypothetical protein
LNLVRTGKAYVKLSAPYRCSTQLPDYADLAPLAKALIAANVQRMLYGKSPRIAYHRTPILQVRDHRYEIAQ